MIPRMRLLGSLLFAWSFLASQVSAITVSGTILVFSRDTASAYAGTAGLNAYGIPYQVVVVPQDGITLPSLNSSATNGNYGGFIILSELAYEYTAGWGSALTTAQWQQLYDYQTTFGVRMVRLDVYPSTDLGVTTAISGSGCCDTDVEQLVSFSDVTAFPTAGLKTGAGVTTEGLWHYPATITNASLATEFAQFAPGGPFTTTTTAAVINDFGNREQMLWFTSWGNEWSATSNYLQHAHIHWMTRGLYAGLRRVYFSSQVDDMQLSTDLYQPAGTTFRLRTSDLVAHITWQTNLNSRLPAGSSYVVEIGHNGNGNIENAINVDTTDTCVPPDAIEYDSPPDTSLEFQKPLGTGTNVWPTTPASYTWTLACAKLDALGNWFTTADNRNAFFHISHTFTHEALNNATYSDTNKEITFNKAWLAQIGFTGTNFSPNGLIPPAITGLHNGDAIKAFLDNGINYVVGDNSRPVLLSTENEHWPLISTVAGNGYAGLTIIPRWSNPIYYNCDLANCTLTEWITTSGGWGDFQSLLDFSKTTYTHHLLGLRHDSFMFHQANMRQGDVPSFTVGSTTGNLSLLQIFVETVLQELMRLTNWPIVTLKHDDLGSAFTSRMTRDGCAPTFSYTLSTDGKSITGATLGANGNTCSVPIPVTFPVAATASCSGCTTSEQRGSDPLTLWTTLSGSAVSFTLASPIAL